MEQLVFPALNEFNEEFPENKLAPSHPEMHLFGHAGCLDSISLVRLLILLEQNIKSRTGQTVRLLDSRALAQKNNPFATPLALSRFIYQQLDKNE